MTEVIDAIVACVRALPGELPRSGVGKLLVGSGSERVAEYRSHPLYNRLAGINRTDVTAQVDVLLERGILAQNSKGHLVVTSGAAVRSVEKHPGKSVPPARLDSPSDSLFEQLRAWRLTRANADHVPAYVVFADETLRGIVALRPQSLQDLSQVRGIGTVRVEKYGTEILAIVNGLGRSIIESRIARNTDSDTDFPLPADLLFERLRVWRLARATADGVPAFIICTDKALHEIVSLQPQSPSDLLGAHGIGKARIAKYGAEILAVMKEHNLPASETHATLNPDAIKDFFSRPHPRTLIGPWLAGWALDFHSRFDGDLHSRSVIGQLVFRFKYREEQVLARELASHWYLQLTTHPELPCADVVIPIPSSKPRTVEPVTLLAQSLAEQLGIPTLAGALVKTRSTKPQKELTSAAQKQANVRGSMALAKHDAVNGKHVILVDDLYDSGATLHEAARILSQGRAKSIVVLTLTKTIHADT